MIPFYSCEMISSNFALNFNGHIDTGGKCITICCEGGITDKPAVALGTSPRDTLSGFIMCRADIIAASKQTNAHPGCSKCANWRLNNWQTDGLIHYVNLSMYPAPCQCKCIYCNVHYGESSKFNHASHDKFYEIMFDTLNYAQDAALIAPNALWQVSSGEITIHPYKNRIIDLVRGHTAVFYTNCFIFDEDIAANLHENPRSAINLSIDAGTHKTWHKVKGVANFDTVTDNLVKYYKASVRPGQISLKYIVLPGVNDNWEDYLSVVEIMKVLEIKHLSLSRDVRLKYTGNSKSNETLIAAAGCLTALLHKNSRTMDMITYTPEEREHIIAFASRLLRSNEIVDS